MILTDENRSLIVFDVRIFPLFLFLDSVWPGKHIRSTG